MCKSLKTFEGDRLFPVNKIVNNVHNPSGKLSGYPHESEKGKEPPWLSTGNQHPIHMKLWMKLLWTEFFLEDIKSIY